MTGTTNSYILVTGGAGYIGSHTVVELINHGYNVVIVDNLSNSSYDAVSRVEYIVKKPVPFFNVDLRDSEKLGKVFEQYDILGVIHFAALKAVGESTHIPLKYYDNNVNGTIKLLETMAAHKVKTIVFSSSATVYGDVTRFKDMIPIPEHCPNDPTNPYGKTKYVIENILHDIYNADTTWKSAILRYFNPIGAHPSGLIGEDPLGIPNNLLPYLAQVAIGRREKLSIFGNDYDSHDGTPIRDYIHVVDLAKGHIAALEYLNNVTEGAGLFREWNLGTGKGSTVFDVYHAFCKAVGHELPYEVVGRRDGDVLDLTANATRANTELKWSAEKNIDDACRDLWKWTTDNPKGYAVAGYQWTTLAGTDGDYTSRVHTVTKDDLSVSFLNYGASIQKVEFKNQNLVCGLDTLDEYKSQDIYLGATVGRYANRIANGQFEINGETVKLDKNNGENSLHGGSNGFNKQNFLGPIVKRSADEENLILQFVLVDKAGANGFPGELIAAVEYTVGNDFVEVEYSATTDASGTPVNLTNHSYWNLAGNKSTIDGTQVKLATSKALEVDPNTLIPTGNVSTLDISNLDGKVDNCLIVRESSQINTSSESLVEVLEASHPDSTLVLRVETTEPSFQLYTGDYVDIPGKFGPRCGFCVEPGRLINAVNVEKWKQLVLLDNKSTYGSRTRYSFKLKN